MGNTPLTPEQVCFAAKNHRLIYRYLKKKHLSKEEYYDVAVFGYLKAVQDYFSKEDLKQYAFSTLCFRYMSREISNYHKSLMRQKRVANIVCIHSGQEIPIECRMPYGHSEMMKMESRLLLHDLARHIPETHMGIVRRYCAGKTMREIARGNRMKLRQVRQVLYDAYTALKQLCYINEKEVKTNEPGETNRDSGRQPCTTHTDRAQGDYCP